MIYPKVQDILRTIETTLATKVEPELTGLDSRSAMATVRHLLRHVIVRSEQESRILLEDVDALCKLLPRLQSYLAPLAGSNDEDAPANLIAKALAGAQTASADMEQLSSTAAELRECLYQGLKQLQAIRDEHGGDPEYREIRQSIRDYMAWQIKQENKLIAPAFYGKGPRR